MCINSSHLLFLPGAGIVFFVLKELLLSYCETSPLFWLFTIISPYFHVVPIFDLVAGQLLLMLFQDVPYIDVYFTSSKSHVPF
jgi:hypothetical protein